MDRMRVLVVDDDSTVSRILGRVFERSGLQVTTAPNGKRALDILTESAERFDAMVCDIQMPYMTGRELVRHLTTEGPYLPGCVFIVTSRSESEERDWVKAHEGISLVEKPVSPKQILRLLKQRLGTDTEGGSDEPGRRAA